MSPAELVTNTGMLKKLGIETVPALRAAFEAGLKRAAAAVPGKAPMLKTQRAAEALKGTGMAEKLHGLQDKQIAAMAVEGDWLIVVDISASMDDAIESARHIAATLAVVGTGKVSMVFVNDGPRYFDATGKTLDAIVKETKHVTASGCTNLGCGISYAIEAALPVDGIVLVSDGGENRYPVFAQTYTASIAAWGKAVPVYHYLLKGERDACSVNMQHLGHDMQQFDLRGGVDYYSLPNLVQTMRVNRYSLIDEVMATPLRSVAEIFKAAA